MAQTIAEKTRIEHSQTLNAKRVVLVDPVDGGAITDIYTEAYEYDGSGNAIYIGKAATGTGKAATGWQIAKITYDVSNNATDKQWAGGSGSFTNIWNSRAGYSYS